jgi:hypothetical protein
MSGPTSAAVTVVVFQGSGEWGSSVFDPFLRCRDLMGMQKLYLKKEWIWSYNEKTCQLLVELQNKMDFAV